MFMKNIKATCTSQPSLILVDDDITFLPISYLYSPSQNEQDVPESVTTAGAPTAEQPNVATSSRACAASLFNGTTDKCISCAAAFAKGGVLKEHARDALLYMIVHDDMPLSTPQKYGFQTFVKALQPLYKLPTEHAVKKSLEAKYEELRA
ncbi:hypothetical protein MTO96_041614, partial [Rhipicephalus appendiculatus]